MIALLVETMRIPFTKDVIRSAVDGVTLIEGTHVHRKLVEHVKVELCRRENIRIGLLQQFQRAGDQFLIRSARDADLANVKLDWLKSRVRIRLRASERVSRVAIGR